MPGFCFFCFFFLFASVSADVILNPSASSELDWSGASFSLYTICTNSVLCCCYFPPLILYLNHLSTTICKHTHYLCSAHIKLLIPNRATTSSWIANVAYMQRSFPVLPKAMTPVYCMLPPPVACVLMDAMPFNSDMKMLWKEMLTVIFQHAIAALLLSHSVHYYICLLFLNAFIPLSIWQGLY